VAEVFAALPTVPMNIEIKQTDPPLAVSLCQMIRDAGMADRVLVASFHREAMEEFRRECSEVATSTSEDEVAILFVLSKVFLEASSSPAAGAVQVPDYRSGLRVLTPRFVDAAQRRNLQVHAWTINDVAGMERMLALGVDGIITDHPDRLLELLGR
jgi:glycerophosphoryl diester phosphodiesterase